MENENLLGNKLYELRKQARYSQEELAEKLNVSRQAVSKWECGDSLPDTENLIALSKLYDVSLDALIGNSPSKNQPSTIEETSLEEIPATPEDGQIESENTNDLKNKEEIDTGKRKKKILKIFLTLPYPILITIIYLLWGFLWDGWAVGWTLYVTVPIYYSIFDCIKKKKASHFAYPVLVTFIYLFVGMQWGFWHPNWVIFITIPIYYAITDAIEKK